MPHFHVSSTLNRDSIRRFGLDWARMGAAPGIAGSRHPEADGIFLCTDGESEADWFIEMNNTGGPVDLWKVDGIDWNDLIEATTGYWFYPGTISATALTLVRQDLPPVHL